MPWIRLVRCPRLYLPVLLLVGTAATPGGADDASDGKVVHLEAYPVVAPPIVDETAVDRLGSHVTTITQQQLAALNAHNLQSALRETPGIVVSHHNPVGSFGGGDGGGVFIRGLGSARPGAEIQLSVDGVASFNSIWTHPLLDMLSIDLARRIEIYKGAQPVLFGNMAFAVVDLAPKYQESPGQGGQLTLSGGSFGTWSATAEAGGRAEALDYYVLGSARASDGHRANSDGRLLASYLRLGWTFGPHWSAHVIHNRTDNSAEDPGPDPALVPPARRFSNGHFADDNDLVVATLSHRFPAVEGYVKPYWTRGTLDWTGQYHAATRRNENVTVTQYDNRGVKIREILRPWTGGEVLGGVDFDFIAGQYRTVTGGTAAGFPRRSARMVSPYASIGHRRELANDWFLRPSIGARRFDHSVFADELAPQAALTAGGGGWEFHVSGARGINYPGLFVMAIPPGNNRHRELKAERVNHWELGASRRFGTLAKAELTLFRDRGSDRIVTVFPPFPPVWSNLGRFETEGVEAAFTLTPERRLSFYGGVTAMSRSPDDLPYAPDWSASAGLNWRFGGKFQLGLDSQYVGSRFASTRAREFTAVNSTRLDSYTLLNLRLAGEFRLPAWSLAGEWFVAGENLADADYQQKDGYPMPGIGGTFGVKLKF